MTFLIGPLLSEHLFSMIVSLTYGVLLGSDNQTRNFQAVQAVLCRDPGSWKEFWEDETRRSGRRGRWQTGNNYVPRHSFLLPFYRMLITEDRCEGGVCGEKDWSKTDGKGWKTRWLMGNITPLYVNVVSPVINN